MLNKQIFYDFSGEKYTYSNFLNIVKKYYTLGYILYIGSDTQILKNKINAITAFCFRKESVYGAESGKIFYIKTKFNKKDYESLKARMQLEAFQSVQAALDLDEITNSNLIVHLDVGSTNKSKTSTFSQELQNLVIGQGYKCEIKPNSWASSAVADRMSRDE